MYIPRAIETQVAARGALLIDRAGARRPRAVESRRLRVTHPAQRPRAIIEPEVAAG